MSLQLAWIDRIHARILVRYGAAWIRMWDGVEPEAVKADWAQVLAGLSPESIAHALDNLPPDRPPTALQFRDLCRSAPSKAPALTYERPKPNPERLAEVLARLDRKADPARETLARLRALRDAGTLSAAQRAFLQQAEAGMHAPSVEQIGDFVPINPAVLPPGMRGGA
jgi:hypothetical protein